MKKLKYFLLILIIPCLVSARSYNDSMINYVRNYIKINSTYSRYIITDQSKLYGSGSNNFSTGGLLSYDEFYASTLPNNNATLSWLFDGEEYWTYTNGSGGKKVVSDLNGDALKNGKVLPVGNSSPGIRVTEYVKPKASVLGEGTKSNPWIFSPSYDITIESNNKGKIESSECSSLSQTLIRCNLSSTDTKNIVLKPNEGVDYLYNTCEEILKYKKEGTTEKLILSKPVSDKVCNVYFGS